MKFSPLQVVESKHFGGLLTEENLGWLGINTPTQINEVLEPLYDVMLGADNYVNFINRLNTFYIESEGDYQWDLSGQEEKALPLVKATWDSAGATQVAPTDRIGLGGNSFFLWFNENYFNKGSQLHGMSPERYKMRIVDQPTISGTLYGYKVQPILASETDYVPYQELVPGIRFAEMGALVENEFSRGGNGVHFASNNKLRNTTSTMRKDLEMSGSLINKKTGKPGELTPMFTVAFDDAGKALKAKDGSVQKYWIDAAWWQFLKEIRREKAMQILYGSSNRMSDGTYLNRGENGNVIRSFSGLYEQMNAGNFSTYNTISADALLDYCMQISVGKIAEGNRRFMITCGEWGFNAANKAFKNYANANTNLRFTHNVVPDGKFTTYDEKPYSKFIYINGIELDFVIDPFKDNEVHNQQKHPLGGTKASYDYDIFAMGENNENVQIVKVKGNEDYYRCIEGMRSPYTPGNGYMNPSSVATEVDGFKVMWEGIISARIKNPLKTGRLTYNGPTIS